jgi:hypothetical protein
MALPCPSDRSDSIDVLIAIVFPRWRRVVGPFRDRPVRRVDRWCRNSRRLPGRQGPLAAQTPLVEVRASMDARRRDIIGAALALFGCGLRWHASSTQYLIWVGVETACWAIRARGHLRQSLVTAWRREIDLPNHPFSTRLSRSQPSPALSSRSHDVVRLELLIPRRLVEGG